MKTIVAKKLGMSQIFNEDGTVFPVTLLSFVPGQVAQVKTVEKDGYSAMQVGIAETKKPRAKASVGHTKALGKTYAVFQEIRLAEGETATVGDALDLSQFAVGDFVKVTGTSKGKGFQGVVKRHHFGGGPASHGHKDNLRMPGSIGSGGMQRVFKGLRMGGRMGGEQVTTLNQRIVAIDTEKGLISLRGAVPGAMGSLITVTKTGVKRTSWK